MSKSPSLPKIVIRGDDSPVSHFAARELRRYLKRGGVRFDLDFILDVTAQDGDGFSYRYHAAPSSLEIAGHNPRSLLHGVYAFLEHELGFRWFTPDEDLLPKSSAVKLGPDCFRHEMPRFANRFIFPEGDHLGLPFVKRLTRWAPKQGLTGLTLSFSGWKKWRDSLTPELAKRGLEVSLSGHCLDLFVPKSAFQRHPEWFAEIKGRRVPDGQYCFSSVNLRTELARRITEAIAEDPLVTRLCIWAQDTPLVCTCKMCAQSGFLTSFAECIDVISRRLRRVRPEVTVEFLAYNAGLAWDMLEPPPTLPSMDCGTQFAYWGRDYRRPLGEDRSRAGLRMKSALRAWTRRKPASVHVLEYYTDLWMHTHLMAPLPSIIKEDMKSYASRGIRDISTLIVLTAATLFERRPPMATLAREIYANLYFFARAAWNPTVDTFEDYCHHVYGRHADLCRQRVFTLQSALATITSLNRVLFRLRFVDPWYRDLDRTAGGGVTFVPTEWNPDLGWTSGDEERLTRCSEMLQALTQEEATTPWPPANTLTPDARALKDCYTASIQRIKGYHLQFMAQKLITQKRYVEAIRSLDEALRGCEPLSPQDARICHRWLTTLKRIDL